MNGASAKTDYDVVIIGGALAGASSAILLLREQPDLRVLIVEKSATFGRRVGEATVEVSAYFLCRVLGLTQFLNETQLMKQGMRFWFANPRARTLEDCSEIGGKYLARVAAFQVDRSVLDEEVLRRAAALGAEVRRPAAVGKIQLNPGGTQTLEARFESQTRTISARWIVDASGVAAILARQEGWWRANEEHPTTAVWARWTGVKDWDSCEVARKFPKFGMSCWGIRGTATNHIIGNGWWAWVIPLKGGDVSVGVVFDQRLVQWPEGGSLGARLKEFLSQHPVGREIMADAQWCEGDVHWRKNLPYYSTTFAGDGFALVGDASAFMDPFYSPGMDWISFTSWSATRLILAQRRGEDLAPRIARHNRDFSRSYDRWFRAIYKDKYEYMGDYELMRLAFRMDVGLYYLGVAAQPFRRGPEALSEPVFSTKPSVPFFNFIQLYNRRFARIAQSRRKRRKWGRQNDCRRFMIPGFTFTGNTAVPVVKAMFGWAWLELREGWRTWFAPQDKSETEPQAASAAIQTVP